MKLPKKSKKVPKKARNCVKITKIKEIFNPKLEYSLTCDCGRCIFYAYKTTKKQLILKCAACYKFYLIGKKG